MSSDMVEVLGKALSPVAADLKLQNREAAWIMAWTLKRVGFDKQNLLKIALRRDQPASVADALIQVTFDIDDISASLLINAKNDLNTVAIAEAFQMTPLALLELFVLSHISGFKNDARKLQKVREAIAEMPGLDLTLAYITGSRMLDA